MVLIVKAALYKRCLLSGFTALKLAKNGAIGEGNMCFRKGFGVQRTIVQAHTAIVLITILSGLGHGVVKSAWF
jgi:hypothetical protein